MNCNDCPCLLHHGGPRCGYHGKGAAKSAHLGNLDKGTPSWCPMAAAPEIPTPDEVAARRQVNRHPQIVKLTTAASEALTLATAYPVSVPVRAEPYDVEVITAVVETITARGWAVSWKPGDNMMLVEPS